MWSLISPDASGVASGVSWSEGEINFQIPRNAKVAFGIVPDDPWFACFDEICSVEDGNKRTHPGHQVLSGHVRRFIEHDRVMELQIQTLRLGNRYMQSTELGTACHFWSMTLVKILLSTQWSGDR